MTNGPRFQLQSDSQQETLRSSELSRLAPDEWCPPSDNEPIRQNEPAEEDELQSTELNSLLSSQNSEILNCLSPKLFPKSVPLLTTTLPSLILKRKR